jgi:hypothetical protein
LVHVVIIIHHPQHNHSSSKKKATQSSKLGARKNISILSSGFSMYSTEIISPGYDVMIMFAAQTQAIICNIMDPQKSSRQRQHASRQKSIHSREDHDNQPTIEPTE